jgi:hypothetical protein
MWEKENSIGAAQLQAEGLEGVFNIAKLFAELASQMAQREIQVEDLIIQTDRGTLKPGMNEEDAQQFEADIRDVFMDPENKKAFRVFMEDPDGKRTLIFESKEGKVAPDLYDLRRSMMQFYAKSDAEEFGRNFDEYFDEVVIKTGQAEAQAALGETQEDPSTATVDVPSQVDLSNTTIDVSPQPVAVDQEQNIQAATDSPAEEAEQDQLEELATAENNDYWDDWERSQPSPDDSFASLFHYNEAVDRQMEMQMVRLGLSEDDPAQASYTQEDPSTATVDVPSQVDLSNTTIDVSPQPATYAHAEPITNADIQAAFESPQHTQQQKNETFILSAISPALSEANLAIDKKMQEVAELASEYATVEGVPGVEDFLQNVMSVGEQITSLQSQMNDVAEGSIALTLSGAPDLEKWGEDIQTTLVEQFPSVSENIQALAQQLVEYIKTRASQDIENLRNSMAEKFSETMDAIADFTHDTADNIERLLTGSTNIDEAILTLVDEHGENGILEGDRYTLHATEKSVTRKEDGQTIYQNGLFDSTASKFDKQAVKDMPRLAQEYSQQETQQINSSLKC